MDSWLDGKTEPSIPRLSACEDTVKLTVTENWEGYAGGRTGCCQTRRDCLGDNQQAAKGRAEIRKGIAVLERQETPGQSQRLWREGLDAGGRRLSKPQREKRP